MVHQRFSTNTFPSWDRAHPYRFLSHNGEINTLRGGENWMHARQMMFESPLFGDDIKSCFRSSSRPWPTRKFDNCLELLVRTGRPLAHAVMMMIPEAWQNDTQMSSTKRAFYEFHSCMMEPWDGPASIAFTDGIRIGAVLDRNGLRPSRYTVTKDGLVVMASETGVLNIPPEQVASKGRLQPGKMFLVDTSLGRIVQDEEIKEGFAKRKPYRDWLDQSLVKLEELPAPPSAPAIAGFEGWDLLKQQQAFGYTSEDLKLILAPMAVNGQEPVGSMGTDTPLAVLSDRSPLLFNYFKQLFAQVTNPPIDPIREEMITSAETTIGSEQNLFEESPLHCRQLRIKQAILTNEEMEQIKRLSSPGLRTITLSTLFPVADGETGLRTALDDLCAAASRAISDGYTVIVLSDRGVDGAHAPIPSLLATAAVHHRLIREGTRTRCGLVVESGEPREAMHFCVLAGYGACAVNPYLAFATLAGMIEDGRLKDIDEETAVYNLIKAVTKSMIKVASKMGISTLQSYRGAQIFEAIGLSKEIIDKYFTWTASRIGGVGLDAIAKETANRHHHAFEIMPNLDGELDVGGQYQWRRRGEYHMYNPNTIAKLQHSVRSGNYRLFKEYTRLIDEQSRYLSTLRSLLKFRHDRDPVPLEEVEPAAKIVERFKTGAMSFGRSARKRTKTCDRDEPHRRRQYRRRRQGPRPLHSRSGDWRRSDQAGRSDGSGVTSHYLVSADELDRKWRRAQSREGGPPGAQGRHFIAEIRYSTPGVGSSPPPPHPRYLFDRGPRAANPRSQEPNNRARECKAGRGSRRWHHRGGSREAADVVLISGYDGGTGASPIQSIKHAGIPWELGWPRRSRSW